MGTQKPFTKVQLFIGMLYNNQVEPSQVVTELTKNFGPLEYESKTIPFTYTDYYNNEMGTPLTKIFYSFKNLIDPIKLAQIKIITNDLEAKAATLGKRNFNLDPGTISAANLILLTTKTYAHRVPLQKGIYAEVTLMWTKQGYKALPWTYPDYQSPEYLAIFAHIRNLYLKKRTNTNEPR